MKAAHSPTVGPWTLIAKLGEGGNATVWKATREPDRRPVALKVLKTRNADREPYRRFAREIEVLRSVPDRRGVLPLIDFRLPKVPASRQRPWLAMPIATPIAEALSGGPLESVVAALALGIVAVNLVIGGIIAVLAEAAPFQPDPRQDAPAILGVRFGAGVVLLLMGVRGLLGHASGIKLPKVLGRAIAGSGTAGGTRGFFIYGLTYNAAGIGCTGPILLGLMLYALVTGQALIAFFTFALTMGALMVMVTALVGLAQRQLVSRLRAATHAIPRVGAVMLTTVGIYTMLILSFGPGRELFVRVFLPFLE